MPGTFGALGTNLLAVVLPHSVGAAAAVARVAGGGGPRTHALLRDGSLSGLSLVQLVVGLAGAAVIALDHNAALEVALLSAPAVGMRATEALKPAGHVVVTGLAAAGGGGVPIPTGLTPGTLTAGAVERKRVAADQLLQDSRLCRTCWRRDMDSSPRSRVRQARGTPWQWRSAPPTHPYRRSLCS